LELVLLAAHHQQLLLGAAGGGHILEVDLLELLEAVHAGGDRLQVGEHAAQPALVHVGHAHAGGLLLDGLLRLLLGADEQDGAAVGDGLLDEVVRLVDVRQGLHEVDDVDAVALREDEATDLRVPATGLVTEVDAALQELAHGDDCHDGVLCSPALGSHGAPVGVRGHRAGPAFSVVPPPPGGAGPGARVVDRPGALHARCGDGRGPVADEPWWAREVIRTDRMLSSSLSDAAAAPSASCITARAGPFLPSPGPSTAQAGEPPGRLGGAQDAWHVRSLRPAPLGAPAAGPARVLHGAGGTARAAGERARR